jgi:NAD(P)-dependent dehydrogenase (short-subunit alcohol dehydrogenase family)
MIENQQRVAILVGAANGIGRAIAESLALRGTHLVIADTGATPDGAGGDPSVVEQTARTLAKHGVEVLGLALDAADADTPKALVERAREHFGHVDYGVYTAGYHHERVLSRLKDDELERVLAVHLLGAIRFTRALAGAMADEKRGGSIVLASSAAGHLGGVGQTALASAAGGLLGFVRAAAAELRRHAVRLNAIIPTARTRLTEHLPLFSSIRKDSLTPEHVAQVALFLLAETAREVHGEIVGVAGSRIYAVRHAETSGVFHDESALPTLENIAARWRDVTRR